MDNVTRREFLGATGALAAAAAMASAAPEKKVSANDRLRVGLVGCGGQGRFDTRSILDAGGAEVELVALADVSQDQLDGFAKEVADKYKAKPELYKDYRKLIERKDIDIVMCGTPDHWHAPVTLLACQAGKDVYVEKPLAHNIHEGRAMVNAAIKYKRVVQVGQQQRSDDHFREAMAYLQKDTNPLGYISRTATMNYGDETPDGIGNPPDSDPPKGVDYDMWLGAAPKRPFNPNRWHWSWRWFFDYAGGMMCDWNVHIQDLVHWGMGVDAPLSVYATGGKRVLKDNRETPDIMDVVYEYEGPKGRFTQVYTMGKVYQKGKYPEGYGTEFYGSDGSLFINRGGWEVTPEMRRKQVPDPEHPGKDKTVDEPRTPPVKKPGGDHVIPHARNFLDCVRSRKIEDLHCWVETGHRTASACHLGNIALRVGRKIWWNREKEIITLQDGSPDKEANKWLTREYRKGYELPNV
jgi:predicted dehydrogenase